MAHPSLEAVRHLFLTCLSFSNFCFCFSLYFFLSPSLSLLSSLFVSLILSSLVLLTHFLSYKNILILIVHILFFKTRRTPSTFHSPSSLSFLSSSFFLPFSILSLSLSLSFPFPSFFHHYVFRNPLPVDVYQESSSFFLPPPHLSGSERESLSFTLFFFLSSSLFLSFFSWFKWWYKNKRPERKGPTFFGLNVCCINRCSITSYIGSKQVKRRKKRYSFSLFNCHPFPHQFVHPHQFFVSSSFGYRKR